MGWGEAHKPAHLAAVDGGEVWVDAEEAGVRVGMAVGGDDGVSHLLTPTEARVLALALVRAAGRVKQ